MCKSCKYDSSRHLWTTVWCWIWLHVKLPTGRLTWNLQSHLFKKENDLNQTSRELCSMSIFRGVCTWCMYPVFIPYYLSVRVLAEHVSPWYRKRLLWTFFWFVPSVLVRLVHGRPAYHHRSLKLLEKLTMNRKVSMCFSEQCPKKSCLFSL